MTKPVNIHAAKTHFSRLVERAARGEEIVIARDGRPLARLVPSGCAPPPPSAWFAEREDQGRGGLRCAASCQGLATVLRWLMVFVIAQALDEGLTLVTVDPTMRAYDITVL